MSLCPAVTVFDTLAIQTYRRGLNSLAQLDFSQLSLKTPIFCKFKWTSHIRALLALRLPVGPVPTTARRSNRRRQDKTRRRQGQDKAYNIDVSICSILNDGNPAKMAILNLFSEICFYVGCYIDFKWNLREQKTVTHHNWYDGFLSAEEAVWWSTFIHFNLENVINRITVIKIMFARIWFIVRCCLHLLNQC